MKITTKLWIGIAILIALSPIGLILPEHFKAGAAWGEWGADEMQRLVGYIPQNLAKLSSIWNAPLADYCLKGWEEKGLGGLSLAYIASALIGIAVVLAVTLLAGKLLAKGRVQK